MKLLVLGGTQFVGRHVVEAALARGHAVTMLNRGVTDPGPWPALAQVERLVGDRDVDLSALHGRDFDAVVDCCGFNAGQARRLVDALAHGGRAPPHVVFISSVSAFACFPPGVDFDESAPLAEGSGAYGADKARAEDVLRQALPGRMAIVRPGLVVGPFDPTGRFTYWPLRVARGGRILAPGPGTREVQFIDARDLAGFCVHLAEGRVAGPFIAVGPRLSMHALLEACREVAQDLGEAPGLDAESWEWHGDDELLAAGVAPWTGLPLWIPSNDPQSGGMMRALNHRAVAAGLAIRPVDETIADTLAWARSPVARTPKQVATLDPAREAGILAAFDRAWARTRPAG